MVVVIHQPHFMPWLGYLHRMAQADLFVLLDHVQFERGNYQNRTRIRIGDEARWLTVPVVQHSQKERIVDKEIDNRLEGERWWPRVHFSTLRHAYREAGYFGTYASALQEVLHRRWEKLAELNQAMLDVLREAFGIRTPLVRSSELQVEGSKSNLILDICSTVGAKTLLAGFGGSRTYLDVEAFAKAGVKIAYHEFQHPVYEQGGTAPFIPGLSSIDLLFRRGPQSARLLLGGRTTHESCAAA